MQKVARRVAQVKRQAERKTAQRRGKLASDLRKARTREEIELSGLIRKDIRAERTTRRQDWFLGPLAPRRDIGAAANTYGAIDPRRIRGVEKANPKDWGIVEGDRVVVVLKGHKDHGKIGTVKELQKEREECLIEGLNKTNVNVPEYMLHKESDKTPYRPYELPFPLSSLRLVAQLPHPETGVYRDVVINEVQLKKEVKWDEGGKGNYSQLKGKEPPNRYIAGLVPPTLLPYPKKDEMEWEDNDCDTLRIEVEDVTFTPTLQEPPMPPSIIDELRNKYGKFRTRHDDAYIQKKTQEERSASEKSQLLNLKMLTPLQELHRKERAERKALGRPELSEEMLSKIGEVMVKNKADVLSTRGLN